MSKEFKESKEPEDPEDIEYLGEVAGYLGELLEECSRLLKLFCYAIKSRGGVVDARETREAREAPLPVPLEAGERLCVTPLRIAICELVEEFTKALKDFPDFSAALAGIILSAKREDFHCREILSLDPIPKKLDYIHTPGAPFRASDVRYLFETIVSNGYAMEPDPYHWEGDDGEKLDYFCSGYGILMQNLSCINSVIQALSSLSAP